MNPITNIKNRQRDRENEVLQGLSEKASYHYDFKHSAYIYAGQLSFKLTEGDLLAIFSEYGEIVDVNLVRNKDTGESRGFAFLAYEDQRSTDVAVDNLNGYVIDGRMIAVDHVKDYKRLVDNPDAIHNTQAKPDAHQPSAQGGRPAPDGYHAARTQERSRQGGARAAADDNDAAGAAAPAGRLGASSALADMLAEVEGELAGKPDWRNKRSAAWHHDDDDPMAGMVGKQNKKDKHAKTEKGHKHSKKSHKRERERDTERRLSPRTR